MGEIDGRTGLEVLDWDECLALLSQCSLGRLAVVIDGQPLIFPVNFALDANAVVFRNDLGTKIYGARNRRVAFECDGTDTGTVALSRRAVFWIGARREMGDLCRALSAVSCGSHTR